MIAHRFPCGFLVVFLASVWSSVLFAQTSGLIDTKPRCWPIPYGGRLMDPIDTYENEYVQGPDALRLDNGDIVILVDNGAPEWRYGSEALMALRYPASASEAPRWYPIYATNGWTGVNSPGYPSQGSLHEFEDAFPTSRYFNGMWRTISTSTVDTSFWPCDPYNDPNCTTNRHRLARIDSPLPYLQPIARDQWWLQPIDVPCRNNGVPPLNTPTNVPNSNWNAYTWQQTVTCMKDGSGFGNAAIGLDGQFYVYHGDANYAAHSGCASGLIRHLVNPDLSYTPAGCVTFTGMSQNPGVYDVGIGAVPGTSTDAIFILGSNDIWGKTVDEWYSTDDGLSFQYRTRVVSSFDCTSVGFATANCFVTDLSYLKNKVGRIETPRIYVGVVGGLTGGPVTGNGNNWRLYYWAEAGAALPPNWATPAASCPAPAIVQGGQPSYQGNLDSNVNGSNIGGTDPGEYLRGWAWDWYQPYGSISVDV